ncbi:MAG: QueT transporter family protein [FCB group bacterium]|nr:QueT transporter family protein [FCB group bacterium]
MQLPAKQISIAGVVAAAYFVITITPGINAISYGLVQFRIAEALTVLPFVFPGAIAGVFVGCLLANIFGPVGLQDIIFGSSITFIAAWLTHALRRTGKPALAPIPPIVLNAFGVSAYLHILFGEPYWLFVLSIGLGQTVVCYLLGYPLLKYIIKRRRDFN